MGFKLIATDLDGTLFYPKKRIKMISKKNLRFLRDRIDKGDHIVIVSGRNYEYGKKVETLVGRPLDFVNCNGAFIKVNGEITQNIGLGDRIIEIYEKLRQKFNVCASTIMSEEFPLLINPGKYHGFFKFLLTVAYSFQGVYAEDYLFVDDNAEQNELLNGKVYKLMLFFGLNRKAKKQAIAAHEFLKENYKEVESAFTGAYLEITPAGCNKSEGLKKVLNYYKKEPNELYVIGDSGNDIPMFDAFYHNSFCMKHAAEHVRCHAKHTVKRVYALEEYLD